MLAVNKTEKVWLTPVYSVWVTRRMVIPYTRIKIIGKGGGAERGN